MNQATVYDQKGRVLGRYTCSNIDMLMRNLQGRLWIQGHVPANHYIKNGEAVAMPACPDTDVLRHAWNYDLEQWQVDEKKTTRAARQLRDDCLAVIDRINPVWYGSLTTDQQQQLQQYRAALLTVPQQPGFPTDIEWPTKPAWL